MEIKESVKGRSKKQWVMELVLMHSEELCAFVDAYSTVNLFDGAFIFFKYAYFTVSSLQCSHTLIKNHGCILRGTFTFNFSSSLHIMC